MIEYREKKKRKKLHPIYPFKIKGEGNRGTLYWMKELN